MSDQAPTRDEPVPEDLPVPVETPPSRSADDGPPLVPEEGQQRPDGGQEPGPTAPAPEPDPHETPD
ncbi:hypothetical protein ACFV1W_09180 [Kitasatospora sp. NPDC059648]|uniref:hypothetical protein n=1 Tax=Kitasatospora sp. NPDC059648 TaxID=3346894 RepID=UPI0036D175D1